MRGSHLALRRVRHAPDALCSPARPRRERPADDARDAEVGSSESARRLRGEVDVTALQRLDVHLARERAVVAVPGQELR